MEIDLGMIKDYTKELAKEGNFWDRFKSPEKDGKKIFDDVHSPSNKKKEVIEKEQEIAEKEIAEEIEKEETSPDVQKAEKEEVVEEPKQEVSPEVQRMQARAQELQKEIDLISKELANNATIAVERAQELLIRLAKILAELAKIYASMVQQGAQQYR